MRHTMKRFARITSSVALLYLCSSIQTLPGPDVDQIISHSVQVTDHDWEVAPGYEHLEQDQLDNGTKTYEDLMIEGSPYQVLVKVNGKPLSPAQQADEKKKLEQTIAQRKSESPEQKQQRIEKYQKEQKRDHGMMAELTKALEFRLAGQQRLNGHRVYVLRATPRPGYQPSSDETKVLTGMRGTLWIDTKTYQWVKVQAEVVHPVSIYGFVAKVEPGTMFELEKMPVGEVWLPKHFSMRSHARILHMFSDRKFDDETYSNYRLQNQTDILSRNYWQAGQ
jgi:hypothetical protein